MHKQTILIVDDEIEIRRMLREALERSNFQTREASGVASLWQNLHRQGLPDLILLDLTLPDGDGIEVAQEIRVQHNIPVIMVTGRGDSIDKIIGLESGADDYVCKPFDLRELIARIRSVLRRSGHGAVASQEAVFRFDGWMYDTTTWELTHDTLGPVHLTQYEAKLLHQLLETKGRVLSRQNLADILGGRSYQPQDRSIDNLVSRLRKKLDSPDQSAERIRCIRNVGYQFLGDVARQECVRA